MPSEIGASRALLAVRVITLAPLLWFLLGGGIAEILLDRRDSGSAVCSNSTGWTDQ